MDHPRPGLRYVDAGDLDGSFKFDGLDVESYTEDKLGTVDGFIIDVNSARPFYVVVDAGGWFTSKYFLLPIGHVGLDVPENKLIADVKKENVARYPGFDRDEFNKLSAAELDRLDRQMVGACCPEEAIESDADFARRYDTWKHYQNATWWDASYYRPDRADDAMRTMSSASGASIPSAIAAPPIASRDSYREEQVVARKDIEDDDDIDVDVVRKDDDAKIGDVSPHLGGRAQPGDVLGVETGGEQTHVGDTAKDEDERRRDAEKAAAKRDRD